MIKMLTDGFEKIVKVSTEILEQAEILENNSKFKEAVDEKEIYQEKVNYNVSISIKMPKLK